MGRYYRDGDFGIGRRELLAGELDRIERRWPQRGMDCRGRAWMREPARGEPARGERGVGQSPSSK
ncbi:protein of unknown function [Streptomyces murinus]